MLTEAEMAEIHKEQAERRRLERQDRLNHLAREIYIKGLLINSNELEDAVDTAFLAAEAFMVKSGDK